MLANSTRRRHFGLFTLLFLVGSAVPAQAQLQLRPADEQPAMLARVDGQLRFVSTRSTTGDVRLSAAGDVQLCVVDLAQQALPATAVDFALEKTQNLRLEVLDLDGNLVRTLAQGLWAAGRHQLAWQHDAESGERLEEGLYVVRLVPEAPGERVALAR